MPIPSFIEFPLSANFALNEAALTQEKIFKAQVFFAPSQIIPLRFAIIRLITLFGRSSLPNIYAGGDCASVQDMRTKQPIYSPLATTANKLGRIIGEHIVGKQRAYPGSLSSACVKVFDLEVGRTGVNDKTGGTASVVVKDKNQTNYYPGQEDILLKVIYEETTHRIVGAEVAGKNGAVLRLNTLAMAIQLKGTIEDLSLGDFCYAPPFARTWDVLNIAGNVAMSKK